MIYIVTGKLGAGKSLLAVQRAIDYAAEGRRVAANFPMDFKPLCKDPNSNLSKAIVHVLPSMPSAADLLMLGQGGPHEEMAGALVLDECAQFLNSRQWQGEGRQDLINWLLHARKRRWDVFLIVQHERMLDKQVRDALAEYIVTIRRTDRMKVPFLPVKLPRMHIGIVRYGLEPNALVADRWLTRGTEPMACYDTTQIFNESDAPYTVVSAAQRFKWEHARAKSNLSDLFLLLPRIALYCLVKAFAPASLPLITNSKAAGRNRVAVAPAA